MSMQKVSNSGPKLMQGNEACAAGALGSRLPLHGGLSDHSGNGDPRIPVR